MPREIDLAGPDLIGWKLLREGLSEAADASPLAALELKEWTVTLKHVPLAAFALLVAFGAASAGPSQEDLKGKRDAKLKEAWVTKAPWILDYDKAKEEAKKGQKLIFAYFSRSYSP